MMESSTGISWQVQREGSGIPRVSDLISLQGILLLAVSVVALTLAWLKARGSFQLPKFPHHSRGLTPLNKRIFEVVEPLFAPALNNSSSCTLYDPRSVPAKRSLLLLKVVLTENSTNMDGLCLRAAVVYEDTFRSLEKVCKNKHASVKSFGITSYKSWGMSLARVAKGGECRVGFVVPLFFFKAYKEDIEGLIPSLNNTERKLEILNSETFNLNNSHSSLMEELQR